MPRVGCRVKRKISFNKTYSEWIFRGFVSIFSSILHFPGIFLYSDLSFTSYSMICARIYILYFCRHAHPSPTTFIIRVKLMCIVYIWVLRRDTWLTFLEVKILYPQESQVEKISVNLLGKIVNTIFLNKKIMKDFSNPSFINMPSLHSAVSPPKPSARPPNLFQRKMTLGWQADITQKVLMFFFDSL